MMRLTTLIMAAMLAGNALAGTMYEWRDPQTGALKAGDKPPTGGIEYWTEGNRPQPTRNPRSNPWKPHLQNPRQRPLLVQHLHRSYRRTKPYKFSSALRAIVAIASIKLPRFYSVTDTAYFATSSATTTNSKTVADALS